MMKACMYCSEFDSTLQFGLWSICSRDQSAICKSGNCREMSKTRDNHLKKRELHSNLRRSHLLTTQQATMSNIHGLHSLRNDNNAPSRPSGSDDEEDRYVGGVDSRGGGSGLA